MRGRHRHCPPRLRARAIGTGNRQIATPHPVASVQFPSLTRRQLSCICSAAQATATTAPPARPPGLGATPVPPGMTVPAPMFPALPGLPAMPRPNMQPIGLQAMGLGCVSRDRCMLPNTSTVSRCTPPPPLRSRRMPHGLPAGLPSVTQLVNATDLGMQGGGLVSVAIRGIPNLTPVTMVRGKRKRLFVTVTQVAVYLNRTLCPSQPPIARLPRTARHGRGCSIYGHHVHII